MDGTVPEACVVDGNGVADWDGWEPQPLPLTAAAAAWDEQADRLLVFGGQGYYALSSTLYAYDNVAGWGTITTTGDAPSALKAPSTVWDEERGRWWMFGGESHYSLSAENWIFDAETDSWLHPSATLTPAARVGAAMALDAGASTAWLVGGRGAYEVYSDVWTLDVTTDASADWTPVTTTGAVDTHRAFGAAVVSPTTDELMVFGGEGYYDLENEVLCLHLGTRTWTTLAFSGDELPAATDMSAVWARDYAGILLFGGREAYQLSGAAWFVEPTGDCTAQITRLTDDAELPLANAALTYDPIEQRGVVIGGETLYGLSSSVLTFDP